MAGRAARPTTGATIFSARQAEACCSVDRQFSDSEQACRSSAVDRASHCGYDSFTEERPFLMLECRNFTGLELRLSTRNTDLPVLEFLA
jgi:hypothetical protein